MRIRPFFVTIVLAACLLLLLAGTAFAGTVSPPTVSNSGNYWTITADFQADNVVPGNWDWALFDAAPYGTAGKVSYAVVGTGADDEGTFNILDCTKGTVTVKKYATWASGSTHTVVVRVKDVAGISYYSPPTRFVVP